MTKTHTFLMKFFPPWLANLLLSCWYTTLLILIIGCAEVSAVHFIYWGH